MAYLRLLASQSKGTFSATLVKVLILKALEKRVRETEGERKRKVLSMENQSHVLPVGLGRCGNVGKGETVASVLHSHTSCSYNRKHHLNQRLREQKTGS